MVVIGTRGSDLALTQARGVADALRIAGLVARLDIIRTAGDRIQDLSFDKIEGKGFFTKELEDALLSRQVDLAVHSLKDLPGQSTPGLQVLAHPKREDKRDCLLILPSAFDPGGGVLPLCPNARVGTSAVRRKALLLHLRPDVKPIDLRGNVPTRVRKLTEGGYDAIVLAQAGLSRLKLDVGSAIKVVLPPDIFVPAPGQGALGLQMHAEEGPYHRAVRALHDPNDAACIDAERGLLNLLGAGCQTPLGVHAEAVPGGKIRLVAFLGSAERLGEGIRVAVTEATVREAVEAAARRLTGAWAP